MKTACGSAERRATKDLANSELLGRESIEPAGSGNAKKRLLSRRGEPLFYANWNDVVFIHYETDPRELQRSIPYPLDFYRGRAFVSLVAFTMRGMRPRFGGRIGQLLLTPIATHHFLNVRTYVRHSSEPGIYFMREWLSSRIATWLGPWSFGLPYRFGKIAYSVIPSPAQADRWIPPRKLEGSVTRSFDHAHNFPQEWQGQVQAKEGSLSCRATLAAQNFETCAPGSLDEFLLERYSAFTSFRKTLRFFRIWHQPWRQVSATVHIAADDLSPITGPWRQKGRCISANYSPGVRVWMGWSHRIANSPL